MEFSDGLWDALEAGSAGLDPPEKAHEEISETPIVDSHREIWCMKRSVTLQRSSVIRIGSSSRSLIPMLRTVADQVLRPSKRKQQGPGLLLATIGKG